MTSPFLAFGKAPFALFCLALVSGVLAVLTSPGRSEAKPDLVLALFSKEHKEAYDLVIPEFERANQCTVRVQLVTGDALRSRLQAALQSGADVPDVVELPEPSMGYFTKGPLEDVGFVDQTERVDRLGLRETLVGERFALWSSRGRIFGIPHDVHPVALIYRKDLVEQYGIDVSTLDTWDAFLAAGRRVAVDADRDGVTDRYFADLPTEGSFGLQILLWQAGGGYFDAAGRVRFDDDVALRTVLWYVQAVRGPQRIAVSCGWGQPLAKAVTEGLALFYLAPDWRSKQFERDMQAVSGKLAIMPLPAWEKGGRRTSTWGGTGICVTKRCAKPELAWKLIEELYLNQAAYGPRYASSYILPPMRSAWTLPELARPSPFYGGQAIGSLYAELATQIPEVHVTAYEELARSKMGEAFLRIAQHFESHGADGLDAVARSELKRSADYVRTVMARNRFLSPKPAP